MKKYYDLLDVNKDTITRKELRNKYFKQALKYHPDKNDDEDSKEKFQEINEAYEKIMKHHNYYNNVDTSENNTLRSYSEILYEFFTSVMQSDTIKELQSTILIKIVEYIRENCENKALDIFEKFNKELFNKAYNALYTQKDILNINQDFFRKLEELYKTKTINDLLIKIHPTIDDLLAFNLYKLNENNSEYLIPLWHHELVYDNNGYELTVQCLPKLDNGVIIDDNNNIHICKEYNLCDIWNINIIDLEIGNKTINIPRESLKLMKKQTLIFHNIGIPLINIKNIYDVSKRGNIYITINII